MRSDARPPSTDPLVALADRCVQCGLCLPACPTYGHDRTEAESPRGRIALVRAWALDALAPTPIGDVHLDHCLGCRNCETVCPAGVRYDELLVLARGRQRARQAPGWRQRGAEAVATHRRLRATLLGLYRHAFRWLPHAWRVLPQPPPRSPEPLPTSSTTLSPMVALFVGCVAGPYEAAARAAVARLCAALGIAVVAPAGQGCCGSLHAHAGDLARSARLGEVNRGAFADAGTVLTLASGCHDSLARALGDAALVTDAISFIEARGRDLRFRAHPQRVALHLPCTQRNPPHSVPALRRLLARVPGLEVIELDAGFGCCGAAGTQLLTDRERADDYRRPLLAQLATSGAHALLSANIGCRLHLGTGTALPVLHPLEFLAGLIEPTPVPLAHDDAVDSAP